MPGNGRSGSAAAGPAIHRCSSRDRPRSAASQAVESWNLRAFAERFRDRAVAVHLGLPASGGPYDLPLKGHLERMTMAQFCEQLPARRGMYLAQESMRGFPGLADELAVAQAVPDPVRAQNLWLGNATRSGLHFDRSDGLLVQVHGVKQATLTAPRQFGDVYAYPDQHT